MVSLQGYGHRLLSEGLRKPGRGRTQGSECLKGTRRGTPMKKPGQRNHWEELLLNSAWVLHWKELIGDSMDWNIGNKTEA